MDLLSILDRCIAVERGAGEFYGMLAARFRDDVELTALWKSMAREEGEHAHKLATWRELVAAEAPEHRTLASGFEAALAEVEWILARAHAAAPRVRTPDEAFRLALDLETSELDAIYERLLRSSPIVRFPDARETHRREVTSHHAPLVRIVRARSRNDGNLLRVAMLAAEDTEET